MPPKRQPSAPAALSPGKDNSTKPGVSYASIVQANKKPQAPQGLGDLTGSSPDELQAQMNRLLSEVDRVRNALEQKKIANNDQPEDEDEEVLRLQFEAGAAAASLDEDQPHPVQKKPRGGFSPTTATAVAKAFGNETAESGERRGGSPLMDRQEWLQKMLKQMPAQGNPNAPAAANSPAGARAFQTPPPLPTPAKPIANAHDISALSTVPDTSALSDQDQMWGNNEPNVWQTQQPHQRGRGYTNPHRTGAMSYRQNHHHDSMHDGSGSGAPSYRGRGRGGYGGNLFSDDSRPNEYLTTKDYVVVEFKRERTKKYPCSIKVQPGEYVIVDGDRGQDCGLVIQVAYAKEDGTFEVQCIDAMLKNYVRTKPERARVLRVASTEEVSFLHTDIDAMEKAALQTCKAKCDELGITDLKLVDCEFQFDRQKVSFFFDSERSIDFRALVRDLHRAFGIRIWMENINPGVKNSVPADAQAEMWGDEASQRVVGLPSNVGGATTLMMSGGGSIGGGQPSYRGGRGGYNGSRGGVRR
eukprot:GILI01008281.1.p1 GENE.GILI01008281.1~~GILI01008281.1.p1  ORF type:complete len:527 (+),score=114.75 GILI01008281.1:38-1618(+)